ncbi:hypothetical protein ACTFIZ_002661 [Dictyostelium cf. discoideum]
MRLIAALLSVLLIASTAQSTVTIYESSKPGDFDFYLFVQQWIYSYCDSQTCIQNKEREAFTIHGLWPENSDGSYPSFCSGPSFNVNAIQDLEDQLNFDWPSLTGPNTDFWTHEFSKHGTCSITGPITDIHDYFATGIKLYTEFNITAALESENIYPSDSNTYKPADITNAITTHLGGKPGIQCSSGQLSTVAVCIDKDSLSIMDCPDLQGWSCSGSVKFPSTA